MRDVLAEDLVVAHIPQHLSRVIRARGTPPLKDTESDILVLPADTTGGDGLVQLPATLLPHSVTVRRYEGTGPYGEVFADPVTHRAFVEDQRRLVVSASGEEVISETTVHTGPDADVPVGSQVTVWSGSF